MAATTVQLAGKRFVIVPQSEYAKLKQKASMRLRRPKAQSRFVGPPPVEAYSDQRVAEFLLSNSIDADDYARACEDVRKMGIDPRKVRHYKPPGVP